MWNSFTPWYFPYCSFYVSELTITNVDMCTWKRMMPIINSDPKWKDSDLETAFVTHWNILKWIFNKTWTSHGRSIYINKLHINLYYCTWQSSRRIFPAISRYKIFTLFRHTWAKTKHFSLNLNKNENVDENYYSFVWLIATFQVNLELNCFGEAKKKEINGDFTSSAINHRQF